VRSAVGAGSKSAKQKWQAAKIEAAGVQGCDDAKRMPGVCPCMPLEVRGIPDDDAFVLSTDTCRHHVMLMRPRLYPRRTPAAARAVCRVVCRCRVCGAMLGYIRPCTRERHILSVRRCRSRCRREAVRRTR